MPATADTVAKFENGLEIDPYLASAYAEGFGEGEGASHADQIRAWAYLIRTGQCWSLQGWYGRTASNVLASGVVDEAGVIDWDLFYRLHPQD